MQRGNWVPVNKKLVSSLPKSGERPYTELEAAFCLTCDFDNESLVSENGYSKLWIWSRGKVSRFAKKQGWEISKEVRRGLNQILINRNAKGSVIHDPTWTKRTTDDTTGEQSANNRRTTGEQPRPLGNSDLGDTANNRRTTNEQPTVQPTNNQRYTTSYPDPDPEPNPKDKKPSAPKDAGQRDRTPGESYMTHRKRKLSGKRLETFLLFWEAFNYKRGKATAADAWLDIPDLTDSIVATIYKSANAEATLRTKTVTDGKTPQMAQGWITQKRWEDELEQTHVSTPVPSGKKFDKEKYLNGGMNPMLGDDEGAG